MNVKQELDPSASLRTGQHSVNRARLETAPSASTEPIAILGMGCRLPGGADTPAAFWDLMRHGVNTAMPIPSSRWDAQRYYDPNPDAVGKMNVRAANFVEGIDQFDPRFFGISPLEAEAIAPQQRLLLEVTWEALEYAGIAADRLFGSQTGVFIGADLDDYAATRLYGDAPERVDAYRFLSGVSSITGGRLSYVLGLHGPTMQVNTACSSSLLAVHLAAQSLRNQECGLAVAGGAFLMLSPQATIALCKMDVLSPDGRCRTFDAQADGFGRGEGCGMVVLKRVSDAVRDGDNILALIRGSAVNHGGASDSLTAPNGLAHEAMLRQALQNAGVTAGQIQYVETHGTATRKGDRIEVQALANVLGQKRTTPLMLGSVKTNIGHADAAAGIVSLIKVVLALQHGEIPPTLFLTEPNPNIPWESFPLVVPTELTPWPAPADGNSTRLAGVSAFGITGTNVHVIVEEARPRQTSEVFGDFGSLPAVERPSHLLCLSSKDESQENPNALRDLAKRYANFLADDPQAALADICFTANTGRVHFQNRLALVAKSHEALREQLAAFANGQTSERWVAGKVAPNRPKVAFLFAGQGAQYAGMARQLYETQPRFRETLNRCDGILRAGVGAGSSRPMGKDGETPSLLEILYGAGKPQSEKWLDDATYAQPALFAIEYALAELWRAWGIEPDVVIGHSMGEYAAACVAGVFSLEDGLRLIAERGRLIQTRSVEGQMVAALADEARVQSVLQPYAADVSIAVINAQRNVVISGKRQTVQAAVGALNAAGIETRALKIFVASHSPLMDPVLDEFEAVVQSVTRHAPRIQVVSNVTGQVANDVITTSAYWRRHLREPVRFAAGMGTLAAMGIDAFVEIGPQPTLVVLGQQCLATAKDKLWLPSLRRKGEDWQQMLEMLAALYVRGAAVDWAGFDRDYVRHKVVLPTYPFQRKRYWIDFDETRARQSPTKTQVLHPLVQRQVYSALAKNGEILFESTIGLKSLPYLADHRVYEQAVFPTTAYLEMAMAAGAIVFKDSAPSTALRTGCAVENVSIQQALMLSDEQETTTQMVLTPSEAGYGWQVFSRADDKSDWTLHASGNLAIEIAATPSQSRPEFTLRNEGSANSESPKGDLANLLPRLESPDRQIDLASRYQQSREQGIDYGPAFQGVEKLFHGDGEALGHIRLPEDLTASEYTLHPALLDACLQVGVSISGNEPGYVYLPTGLKRLTRFENGAHASVWCHAQVKSQKPKIKSQEIDFDLFDEDGKQVARLAGLTLWSVSRQALLGSHARTDWLYRLDWQASKRAAQSVYAKECGSWLILADEKGIGAELAARLEKQGEQCTLIKSQIPTSNFQSLISNLQFPTFNLRGVVYLANGAIAQQDAPDTARDLYAQALQLTQQIVASGAHPRVWFVTQDAVAVGQVANLSHAPLWGLGRTIAWEHPELQCTCVDVDKATTNLFDEIWFADNETQVALRNGQRRVARLVRHHETAKHPLTIDAQGSYLITGGLGGLGLQVAQWLVAQGARNLTLVGRSRVTEATQPIIAELENAGARIQIVRGDVSQRDDAARMLSASQALAPLKGIIHAAGVLDDGIVLHQTVERFERVSAPKVQGSWYLHTLSENLPLDFFVCFSSVVSLMGNAGQANYAAANAFMDALAHQRRAQGLPALSINWGAWAEVGLAAEVARRGEMEALTPQEGIELLEALMRGTATQVGAMPITWSKFQRQFPASQNLPLLAELLRHTEPKKATAALKQQLAAAPAEQRYGLLKSHLQAEMSAVLGTIPDDSQRFVELGMTSLTAIQLANRLSNHLGVALPVTSALEYPTIELLTNRVAELVFNGHAKRKPSQEVAAELKPVARDRDMPLSLSQQQLWQRAQLHPDGFARNLAFYYRLDGKLNVAVLRASLDELMRRHEILRTSFALKNDSPVQVIAPNLPVNLSRIDLRNAPEPSKEIERRAQAEMHRPFDFATAPLWRVTLMQLGDGSFVLGLVAHHIIMDVASVEVFLKELGLLYSALLEGEPSPLPALPIQYADYAYWQRQTLTAEVLDARRNYWKQWLAEEPPPLKLTIDQPRPPVETFRTGSEWRQISPELTRSIATVSQQSGVTPFTTVLTSFVMLLHRYSGSEKIVVGVPLAGRNHQLLESLIGEFETGTFPLCIELQDQPGFVKLLKRIQRTYLSALAVGDAPVEPLVRTLQPERDLRRHPLCRVLLNWLAEIPGTNLKLADVTVAPMHPEGVLGRDLVLNVWEEKTDSGIALRGQWFYRAELFEPGAIAKMADDFRVILEQIVATPAQ